MRLACPQCHHLFRVVTEENKKLVEVEKVEDFKEGLRGELEEAVEILNPLGRPKKHVPGSFGKEVAADDLTYEYRFKCTNCGYEWTELKEEERITNSPKTPSAGH